MSSDDNDYPPSIPLCRLYERLSKRGTRYLTCRLGLAKVVILKSSETADDGTPLWSLLLQEAQRPQQVDSDGSRDRQRPVWQKETD